MMLGLWHQRCRAVLGSDREVGVANRREYGPTKRYKGALNTAVPMCVDGKPMLVLLFENTDQIEPVLLTHELGHWVLELMGFKGVRNPNEPHSDQEIMLNSMSQHPALYTLQRSLGHDPQAEIDKRARHNLSRIKSLSLATSPPKSEQIAEIGADKVLLYADDILNCSGDIGEEMSAKLREADPKAADCVRDIRAIRDSFDPAELVAHAAFVKAVMRRLDFGSEWITVDGIAGFDI